MRPILPAFLLTLAAALAALDVAWALAGHYQLDWAAYLRLCLLSLVLLAGARVYQTRRPDPRLAAMLFGSGFLCAFSVSASVLNYLLLTRAGARIDFALAAIDRALGFDWPAAMAWMARHPVLNGAALVAYSSMLPQVALMTILLATRDPARVYRFCAAIALSALACIAVWSLAPSFGAFSVYPPPPHMLLALDSHYAQVLTALLRNGPGRISPHDAQGLIGFPSYHAVLALLVAWHARGFTILRWPLIALNGAVLLATPIQGGHHLVDVLAAVPVAALALLAARHFATKCAGMVNQSPKFTLRPIPQGLFRIIPEQSRAADAPAIKPKLSHAP